MPFATPSAVPALARFLPEEVAPRLAAGDAGLREGRRQTASILFLDLRNSTALAERMDPKRLLIFITSFRRRVIAAARAHGGVVDKFIGDGALIVFGVPEASPDDAARALACARRLEALIAGWNAKRRFDPPLRIGIGVHCGEILYGVVGDASRLELTVLGDAVNVAARLEQATKRLGHADPRLRGRGRRRRRGRPLVRGQRRAAAGPQRAAGDPGPGRCAATGSVSAGAPVRSSSVRMRAAVVATMNSEPSSGCAQAGPTAASRGSTTTVMPSSSDSPTTSDCRGRSGRTMMVSIPAVIRVAAA